MLRNGISLPIRSERVQALDNQIHSGIHGENGSASHNARRATTIKEVKNGGRMSTPFDQFANLQGESNERRLDFIRTELALCFTFSTIAAQRYDTGNQESARKSMANAEKAYETVSQFLSDPK